jgi:glucosylceramidase
MSPNVQVWFTSEDAEQHRLSRQPDLVATPVSVAPAEAARLDPSQRYQSILGMGSSFEEASVYHLMRMAPELRRRVLRDLVHPQEGIGWNLMRICFGASDFTSAPYYSYDDMPPGQKDPELAHFSIQKDIDLHILEVLHEALAINPELRFFASPWSPPGWMKSNDSMCGGHLLPGYYATAARYYRMAIQAYQEQGIPIHAFTLQNEPMFPHPGYPTCYYSWEDQRRLLLEVREEFDRHNLETEIWIFDHNFAEAMTVPGRILGDPKGYAATDGVAFHDYEGEPSEMGALHRDYPDKPVYMTEHSTWGTRGIERILQYLRNDSRSYSAWVTCLNDVQEPNPGPHSCSPTIVTVSRLDPNEVWYIPEYYMLGQITRFVRAGARRIACDPGSPATLTQAAFQNPDGEMVAIVVNQTQEARACILAWPGWLVRAAIPAKTVATLAWGGGA